MSRVGEYSSTAAAALHVDSRPAARGGMARGGRPAATELLAPLAHSTHKVISEVPKGRPAVPSAEECSASC